MIKTSIIVPVYNTAEYLRDCFDSIYNQTQKEIEVIAINDGSTDDSLNILEEIKREHPKLIIYSQENKGLGAARNKGMELATGEFIYFIDSDDCIISTAMDTCYRYAKEYQLDMLMFDADTFGEIAHKSDAYDRSKLIEEQEIVMSGEEYAHKYWLKKFSPTACLIYTETRFLKRNRLKFLSGVYYEDNEFHCKAIPLANRIMYIPQALYRRRYRETSITTSAYDLRHARDYLCVIKAVEKQKCNTCLEEIKHQLKMQFLRTLYKNSVKNNLLQEHQFAKEFFETALQICGKVIENINEINEIETLYLISEALPKGIISDEMGREIRDQRKKVRSNLFAEIPLQAENKKIGIYGTGRHTDTFLNKYQEYVGEIKAEIIPIESNVRMGEKMYRNRNVVNIEDIGIMSLDCIIIASSKYEQEMYQTIKEKYMDRFKIICLKSDLSF